MTEVEGVWQVTLQENFFHLALSEVPIVCKFNEFSMGKDEDVQKGSYSFSEGSEGTAFRLNRNEIWETTFTLRPYVRARNR